MTLEQLVASAVKTWTKENILDETEKKNPNLYRTPNLMKSWFCHRKNWARDFGAGTRPRSKTDAVDKLTHLLTE